MPSSYEFKKKKNSNKELAHTMPKNLLVWRKTSLLLKSRSSTISFESRRVCSKVEATWHRMPPLKPLIDASSIKGSPLSMGAGRQAWGSRNWLSILSTPRLGALLTFSYFAALWASSSLVGRSLPISIMSLPFCSLLFLGSTCSVLKGRVGKHEEETLAEEVEAWVGQTSQILLFLAGSLTTPIGFFGVFFRYPSRRVGSWGTRVG